ncbi:MAG: 4Fe-4S binding protein [Bacteroidales bacterium]|jgi:ferredoxin|nr:4Fe-4S binding protein [Bacteroidales bacterium]
MAYYIIPGGCISCGVCVTECPQAAILSDDDCSHFTVESKKCNDCGVCAEICPVGALDWIPV